MEEGTWLKILSTCDEVEALLRDASPAADPMRVKRVQFLCATMCGPDSYITEKANKIASRIGDYCSARKHLKAPRGAQGLMQEMRYSWLPAIRQQATIRINAARAP